MNASLFCLISLTWYISTSVSADHVSLNRSQLCICLSSSGITQHQRYYANIRFPNCCLTFSLFQIVMSYSWITREQKGLPRFPDSHCGACVALRFRGWDSVLAIMSWTLLFSRHMTPSTILIFNHYGTQSLSRLLPDCQRLKICITAYPPWLATGGSA